MCRIFGILFFLLSALCACQSQKPPRTQSPAVKIAEVVAVGFTSRDFAGMATADDAVNLAFKIAGQVESVDVSKGDLVAKGALLAQLEPRDVVLQVASDRSQYEKSRSQYERMRRLLDHEAVSQQEFESAQASFIQARSTYENSKDLLSQTKLRAPFAGVIERVYVDAYQRVQSGETILRLVNPQSTTIEFTMPEKSLYMLSDTTTRFSVTFDNIPHRRFAARLHKFAKTSSDASGFPVALKISRADSELYGISPGMTCQITMLGSGLEPKVAVPLSAIFAPASGGVYVWIVGEDNRVELRAITLGEIYGRDMVVVGSGLTPGLRVVVAGVYKLRDGDKVRII